MENEFFESLNDFRDEIDLKYNELINDEHALLKSFMEALSNDERAFLYSFKNAAYDETDISSNVALDDRICIYKATIIFLTQDASFGPITHLSNIKNILDEQSDLKDDLKFDDYMTIISAYVEYRRRLNNPIRKSFMHFVRTYCRTYRFILYPLFVCQFYWTVRLAVRAGDILLTGISGNVIDFALYVIMFLISLMLALSQAFAIVIKEKYK